MSYSELAVKVGCPKCGSDDKFKLMTVISQEMHPYNLLYVVYKCHIEDVKHSKIYKLIEFDRMMYSQIQTNIGLYSSSNNIIDILDMVDGDEIIVYNEETNVVIQTQIKFYKQNNDPIICHILPNIYSYIDYGYQSPWYNYRITIHKSKKTKDSVVLTRSRPTTQEHNTKILVFENYHHKSTLNISCKFNSHEMVNLDFINLKNRKIK